MFKKKEISYILAVTIVLGFTVSLIKSIELFVYALLFVLIALMINIFAKKITSYYLDSEIEIKVWEVQRFGFKPNWHFKKPIPAGIIMPIIFTALTYGYLTWMACLTFEIKPKVYRAAKRFGLYKYSEVAEYHVALIAAAGIIANLIFSIIGYLIGFSEFSRISIFYAFFNLLPMSELDGNKIFFGSLVLWSFLAALTLIGMGYVFFII